MIYIVVIISYPICTRLRMKQYRYNLDKYNINCIIYVIRLDINTIPPQQILPA